MENITQENLENWLSGALEGGSNYWYLIINFNREGFTTGIPVVDNLSKALLKNPGFEINIYDIENFDLDDEDFDTQEAFLGKITLENIIKGMELLETNYKDIFDRLISGDYDADDCDVWLQLVVMGEVVYC